MTAVHIVGWVLLAAVLVATVLVATLSTKKRPLG
ncbi:hypothetical protein M2175_005330 [Bradyrhizobium elkanii]|jgi:hypothetical protein|nr:hypothetical protein [Bradyrhizobium elkanii]MCS3970856.1 hypothetical protein [Bradyrhizobium japonicum]